MFLLLVFRQQVPPTRVAATDRTSWSQYQAAPDRVLQSKDFLFRNRIDAIKGHREYQGHMVRVSEMMSQ